MHPATLAGAAHGSKLCQFGRASAVRSTPARCCARQLSPPVWRGILPTAGAASMAGELAVRSTRAQHLCAALRDWAYA